MGILEKFSLLRKVAIVTGGAGLYGRFIVEGLAEAGAFVYIASRNIERCREIAEEFKKEGYKVEAAKLDQSDEESVSDLKEKIIREKGRIDILVNNAVLRPMRSYYDEIEKFRISMEVNAVGIFNLTRTIGEVMKNQKNGSIINISSIQGIVGPDFTLYEGTDMDVPPDYFFHKGGLINLTRYFASRLGPYNVRVNSISPGGLYTGQEERFVERYNKRTFLGRMAKGEDIKGVVVFLASDASSYITGTNIIVDGGYTAK
jgi:NAD(P)-dependent dehydrogenase (short-subunit alcohol dehydrogenase family)